VFVAELGESAIEMEVRAWVKTEDYWTALWKMREDTKVALDEAGITIPFAQLDVKIKQ